MKNKVNTGLKSFLQTEGKHTNKEISCSTSGGLWVLPECSISEWPGCAAWLPLFSLGQIWTHFNLMVFFLFLVKWRNALRRLLVCLSGWQQSISLSRKQFTACLQKTSITPTTKRKPTNNNIKPQGKTISQLLSAGCFPPTEFKLLANKQHQSWHRSGPDLALMWYWSGPDVALIWPWCGPDLALMWYWSGSDVVLIWLQLLPEWFSCVCLGLRERWECYFKFLFFSENQISYLLLI